MVYVPPLFISLLMSPSACSSSHCARAHKENKVAGTSTRNHEIKLPATPFMRACTNAWRTCRAPVRPMHTLHSIALDEKGPSVRASNTCVCVTCHTVCTHVTHSCVPPAVHVTWHVAVVPIDAHKHSVLSLAHDALAHVSDRWNGFASTDLCARVTRHASRQNFESQWQCVTVAMC